ncbi:hypothetical protein [Arthrobacter sp. NPDC058127]|uniref:hypothetical protein n=1 Tax=Arthrobacter sp. NPDC058127 TaxID=3346351 RepID=UPI0036E33F72
MTGSLWQARPPRALVVFDVNIYLDVARILGPAATWDAFLELAVKHANEPLPHRRDAALDSLRALAISKSGKYEPGVKLEIWFGQHLDDTTYFKLIQDAGAADRVEDCGFGWAAKDADDFMELLVDPFWCEDDNFVSGDPIGYETPPLDHEDGCVYAIARDAGSENYSYERFCVTRDVDFRNAALKGDIEVMHPHEWVAHVRGKISNGNPMSRMIPKRVDAPSVA